MRVRIYQKHTHQNQQPLLFSEVTDFTAKNGLIGFEHDAHINKERKVRATSVFLLENLCGYSILREDHDQ